MNGHIVTLSDTKVGHHCSFLSLTAATTFQGEPPQSRALGVRGGKICATIALYVENSTREAYKFTVE